jgi:hypothetical protein
MELAVELPDGGACPNPVVLSYVAGLVGSMLMKSGGTGDIFGSPGNPVPGFGCQACGLAKDHPTPLAPEILAPRESGAEISGGAATLER